ncbi:5822_t:CDS:2, partial [Cetraspora pellucida]
RNLEQVHYTPTHYPTVRPSTPPMRRRVNSPFSLKMENDMFRDQGINKHHGNYDQMFAWAKEQVKSTGKVNLPFGKDGSFVGGPYPNDDDFILPPPMIRPTPRGIPRGSPPRRMMVPPPNYPHHPHHNATKPRMIPRSGIEVKRTSNQQMRVPEMNESGVVEKCVNIASNVKDVEESIERASHTHSRTHISYRVTALEPISPFIKQVERYTPKSLEIIEAGHCRLAFPKDDSLQVTAIGLHLNTTGDN